MCKIFFNPIFRSAAFAGVMVAGLWNCSSAIDRRTVVNRHDVVNNRLDSLEALTIGNGRFAFTADITGLQTFPERYAKGVSLGTMSEWGWNSFDNVKGYRFEETLREYDFNGDGHVTSYPVQWTEPQRKADAANWFRMNPHRLHLGYVGFYIKLENGKLISVNDVKDIDQKLDLWTGWLTSRFTVEGKPVEVITAAHQQQDQISVRVKSPLIEEGRLKIRIRYRYPAAQNVEYGLKWQYSERQKSEIVEQNAYGAIIMHEVDNSSYYTSMRWSDGAIEKPDTPHEYMVVPAGNGFELSVNFSPEMKNTAELPDHKSTLSSSRKEWTDFWSRGAAIDFAGSADPRAHELERRVVLSQYLTKVQCSGNFPPQETGLTFNSWYGKAHLEMHWWHAVHFALWNRVDLLENSLSWYRDIMPEAGAIATRQGYEGVRWPKMVDCDGKESPSVIAPFLLWQQPHFIYFAELVYRDRGGRDVIDRYKDLVFATADFMADYAAYDAENDRYNLGRGMMPAQEIFDVEETLNPPYELAYWDWGLRTAQKWRERASLPRSEKWDDVILKLSPPPQSDGVYLATENTPDSYADARWMTDHPSVLGTFGMLPESDKLDRQIMLNTLNVVWDKWLWDRTWGWDFPMTALNAARLGETDKAVEALFKEVGTNTYLKNGHNYQHENLRIYLPGNGGLLAAVAMMAGGWDGSEGELPGFPKDGSWKIKAEGFRPMP